MSGSASIVFCAAHPHATTDCDSIPHRPRAVGGADAHYPARTAALAGHCKANVQLPGSPAVSMLCQDQPVPDTPPCSHSAQPISPTAVSSGPPVQISPLLATHKAGHAFQPSLSMLGRPSASVQHPQPAEQGLPKNRYSPQPSTTMSPCPVAPSRDLQLAEPMQDELLLPQNHSVDRAHACDLRLPCPALTEPVQLAESGQTLLQPATGSGPQPSTPGPAHQKALSQPVAVDGFAMLSVSDVNTCTHTGSASKQLQQPLADKVPEACLASIQQADSMTQRQAQAALPSCMQQQQPNEEVQLGASQAPASVRKGKFSRLRLQPRAALGEPAKSPCERECNANALTNPLLCLPDAQQVHIAQQSVPVAHPASQSAPLLQHHARVDKAGLELEQEGTWLSSAGHPEVGLSEPSQMHTLHSQATAGQPLLTAQNRPAQHEGVGHMNCQLSSAQQPKVLSEQQAAPAKAASAGCLVDEASSAVSLQATLQQSCLLQVPPSSGDITGAAQTDSNVAPGALLDSKELDHAHPACRAVSTQKPDTSEAALVERTTASTTDSLRHCNALHNQHQMCEAPVAMQKRSASKVPYNPKAESIQDGTEVDAQRQPAIMHQRLSEVDQHDRINSQPCIHMADGDAAAGGSGLMSQSDHHAQFVDDWDWQQTQGVFGFDSAYQASQIFASHGSHDVGQQSSLVQNKPSGT